MARSAPSSKSVSPRSRQSSVPREQRERVSARRRWGIADILVCIVLLAFPLLALHKLCVALGVDWRIGYGIFAAISLLAFFVMLGDKRSAQSGEWRTPEKALHTLEWLGGWPGSFLAQRIFWHKVSKTSYQVVFWLIVFVYEFISIDYLQGWKWLHFIQTHMP